LGFTTELRSLHRKRSSKEDTITPDSVPLDTPERLSSLLPFWTRPLRQRTIQGDTIAGVRSFISPVPAGVALLVFSAADLSRPRPPRPNRDRDSWYRDHPLASLCRSPGTGHTRLSPNPRTLCRRDKKPHTPDTKNNHQHKIHPKPTKTPKGYPSAYLRRRRYHRGVAMPLPHRPGPFIASIFSVRSRPVEGGSLRSLSWPEGSPAQHISVVAGGAYCRLWAAICFMPLRARSRCL
jgi:hypothetical protein